MKITNIGMDGRIAALSQVVWVEGNLKIDHELSLYTGVRGRRHWPLGNKTLTKKVGNAFVQDAFDHEQYLVVTEGSAREYLSEYFDRNKPYAPLCRGSP